MGNNEVIIIGDSTVSDCPYFQSFMEVDTFGRPLVQWDLRDKPEARRRVIFSIPSGKEITEIFSKAADRVHQLHGELTRDLRYKHGIRSDWDLFSLFYSYYRTSNCYMRFPEWIANIGAQYLRESPIRTARPYQLTTTTP